MYAILCACEDFPLLRPPATAVGPLLERVAGARNGRAARVVQHITQRTCVSCLPELCGQHRHGRAHHDIRLVDPAKVAGQRRVVFQINTRRACAGGGPAERGKRGLRDGRR